MECVCKCQVCPLHAQSKEAGVTKHLDLIVWVSVIAVMVREHATDQEFSYLASTGFHSLFLFFVCARRAPETRRARARPSWAPRLWSTSSILPFTLTSSSWCKVGSRRHRRHTSGASLPVTELRPHSRGSVDRSFRDGERETATAPLVDSLLEAPAYQLGAEAWCQSIGRMWNFSCTCSPQQQNELLEVTEGVLVAQRAANGPATLNEDLSSG